MVSLVTLPDVVLEHIFSFLSYDNVAQNRVVCKCFNIIGGRVLNKGFYAVERFNNKALRDIKTKLPRRESERRNHPLARQCDVLISVETRINMLAMTFSKWIINNTCCFIPGKVIDEIYRVLRCVLHDPNPPRAHEILQELRDISSMAMEHFDEKILPQMKRNYYRSRDTLFHFSERGGLEELNSIMKKSRLLSPMVPGRVGGYKVVHIQSCPSLQDSRRLSEASISSALDELNEPPFRTSTNSSVTPSDFQRLIMMVSINRRKMNAQSVLLANQAKEISELRKQLEESEAKYRDLTVNLLRSQNSPSTSNLLESPNLKRPREEPDTPDPTEMSSNKLPRINKAFPFF